jgi:Phage integrase family
MQNMIGISSFEIMEQTRASIHDWLSKVELRNGRYLLPSHFRAQPHLSTRQYARIVHAWIESTGLDSSAYGTHSMRRTKAAQIYRKTGNLLAVQLLLGHTKLESTVRYLGIEVETLSASQSRSNSDGSSRPCHLAGRSYPGDDARSCPGADIRDHLRERREVGWETVLAGHPTTANSGIREDGTQRQAESRILTTKRYRTADRNSAIFLQLV